MSLPIVKERKVSQMYISNIKERVEPGQLCHADLGILDIAPKGIYSFPLEKRHTKKHEISSNVKFLPYG